MIVNINFSTRRKYELTEQFEAVKMWLGLIVHLQNIYIL